MFQAAPANLLDVTHLHDICVVWIRRDVDLLYEGRTFFRRGLLEDRYESDDED